MITFALALALAGAACHQKPRQYRPVVDPELLKLTKDQLFEKGEELFGKRRWQRSRVYYQHVYENYPNDPLGRRALLRIADTYYEQNDPINLVEAQYKYRDFINRYPGSDRADYALLQIAMVSFKQMERPDRDQQKTREAVEKFNDMIRAYPRSPLRSQADDRLKDATDRLARHEHIVARYYIKRHSFDSAVRRLNFLIDTYPNYREKDAVFYDLGESLDQLGRKGEARLYFERVVSEFPKSDFAGRAKKRLDQIKA
ncbi:MAG TPA: outer membrane protein assembly factor BamD [Thermoanaerobaculia bacterium]|jgi:outer membrane protein assembly factor BamD|nr:outer membrane protein assembly factor BamD [Thermoanaerobaculia bacterium]